MADFLNLPKCERCGHSGQFQRVVDEKNISLVAVLSLQNPQEAASGNLVLGGPRILAEIEVCPKCNNLRLIAKRPDNK